MKIKRGDIIIADLGQHETSIQSGIRPCVVMSNDMANKHSPVITVVPLTSKIHKKEYLPTHVFLNGYRNTGWTVTALPSVNRLLPLPFRTFWKWQAG